jgi:hypothetical protein
MPGTSQRAPSFGTTGGQGGAGASAVLQNQTCVPSGCPVGHSAHGGPGTKGGAQLHGAHAQSELSPSLQKTVSSSVHATPNVNELGQPAGFVVQYAGGGCTCQPRGPHVAEVRQGSSGESPHVHRPTRALGHALPSAGTFVGHANSGPSAPASVTALPPPQAAAHEPSSEITKNQRR